MMTPLSQSNFEYKTLVENKPLIIKFNRFVQNAVEKLVPSENGKTMMNILVSESIGTNSINLEDKKKSIQNI